MKFSYNWLQDYITTPLPKATDLAELITMRSSEVEGLEKLADDYILDIKVLADRNHYLLSHRGLARELAAIADIELRAEQYTHVPSESSVTPPTVRVETKLCRRAILRTITYDSTQKSWTGGWIERVGIRSIHPVVDITNYTMLALGQPQHAFDADKVKGTIVIREAKAGETLELLPDNTGTPRTCTFKGGEVIHADDEGPIDVAGVKGGLRTSVTKDTKRIILESANFNPVSIRRTAMMHNLRNDASKRFENNLSPHLAQEGMEYTCGLIVHQLKGVCSEVVDIHEQLPAQKTLVINPEDIQRRLGRPVTQKEVIDVLTKTRCEVLIKEDLLEVKIPIDRHDLESTEDISDEIGRLGYLHTEGIVPPMVPVQKPASMFTYLETLKNKLIQKGYTEIYTRSLSKKGDVLVAYPMAADKGALRNNLSTQITEVVKEQINLAPLLGKTSLYMFEIGAVFTTEGEKTSLCIAIAHSKKQKGTITEEAIKQIQTELSLGEPVLTHNKDNTCIYEWHIQKPQVESELPQFNLGSKHVFIPFSIYPFITRDIAVFTPEGTEENKVFNLIKDTIKEAAGILVVKGPDLFDTFSKDGKTSYAYRMVFQAMDRTLTVEEVQGYMDTLANALKQAGYEVR